MTCSATFPNPITLFEMKGRDARDFLNRLTTVNLREMKPGDFKPGFLLNPQGKIQAAFRIAVATPDTFLIEVEDNKDLNWKTSFLKYLDQFTFAEKYEISEKTGLKCAWIFGLNKASENLYETRDDLILLHGSRTLYGTNWTSVWGPAHSLDTFLHSQSAKILIDSEFESLRIQSLVPRIDAELVIDSNPLEIGLREGIADNKGCYPGQEVIEKIISLGSPAKRLALITGAGTAPSVGDKVTLGEGEVGTVSSSAKTSTGYSALTLLRKNAAQVGQKLSVLGSETKVERIANYE